MRMYSFRNMLVMVWSWGLPALLFCFEFNKNTQKSYWKQKDKEKDNLDGIFFFDNKFVVCMSEKAPQCWLCKQNFRYGMSIVIDICVQVKDCLWFCMYTPGQSIYTKQVQNRKNNGVDGVESRGWVASEKVDERFIDLAENIRVKLNWLLKLCCTITDNIHTKSRSRRMCNHLMGGGGGPMPLWRIMCSIGTGNANL